MNHKKANIMDRKALLKQIDPALDKKFSPRLHSFIRRHPMFTHIFVGRDGDRFIGHRYAGDELFHGARLSGVLLGRTTLGCWAGSERWKEDVTFWKRYLEIGRCLTDPKHIWHEEEGRFEQVSPRVRLCRWCGAKFRLHVRTETVKHRCWIQEKPAPRQRSA